MVVTISASYGSGGSVIGPRLAERLGVAFVDRAIPVTVAARLDIPVDAALAHDQLAHRANRWISMLIPAAQIWTGAPTGVPTPAEEQAFLRETEAVVREAATAGGVILGRAGALVLRHVPHALHVRLDGPAERRVIQAMRLEGVDRETAERDLRSSDAARHAYVAHWYRADPADPRHYHLTLDSTVLELDGCVELIALALSLRISGSV